MKKALVVAVVAIFVAITFVPSSYAGVVIYGRGYGHGVGMSMAGVLGMAKAGKNYKNITNYYYPNTTWSARSDSKAIRAYCPKHKIWKTLTVGQYLNRLAEEPDSWPREGLRATIVAARTYLQYKLDKYGNMPGGQYWIHNINPATRPNIVAAVRDTKNQILTYKGKPIVAAYSASSGGFTARMSEVWGGSDASYPYLINRSSPWDSAVSSTYRWTKSLSNASLEKAYPTIGKFKSLQITQRTQATLSRSRVKKIKIVGSSKSVTVGGWSFRGKLGLKSNYFFFSNIDIDNYKPKTYARSITAKRLSRRKAGRYLRLYKSYKSRYRRSRSSSQRRRYLGAARKYYRYYRLARRGMASALLNWKVYDPLAGNTAYVKIRIQKRTYPRKRARYWSLYRQSKIKYNRTRNRTLRKRYLQQAKIYYRRWRQVKAYYKTIKIANYRWTGINKTRTYYWGASKPGKYRYLVYAKDRAGNMQRNVAIGYVRIR